MSRDFTPIFRAILLSTIAGCGVSAGPVWASEGGDVIFVLNGAKSMSAAIGGRPKLEIAREAFAWHLGSLPDKQRVGLVAFGHRKANDCKDVETLLPPGALSPAGFSAAASRVAARGSAPLADAIRTAAGLLPAGKPGTLVVAADSADSCKGDPCAVAAALKSVNKDLVVHVLALGPKPADLPALACIAQTTGGKFIPATTGGDIAGALRQTVAAASSSDRVANGDAWIEPPKEAVAGSHLTVPFDGPVGDGDWITIAEIRSGVSSNLSWVPASSRSPAKLTAPASPGTYEVRYIEGLQRQLVARTIEIKPATVTMQAPERAHAAHAIKVDFSAPNGEANFITIVPAQSAANTRQNDHSAKTVRSPATLRAPLQAGDYEVRLVFGAGPNAVMARQKLTVEAAPPIRMPDLTAEKNKNIEFDIQNAPRAPGDQVYLAAKGSADNQSVRITSVPRSGPVRLYTPGNPGEYELRYMSRSDNKIVVLSRSALIIQ